jgi:general secretion pathway protein J
VNDRYHQARGALSRMSRELETAFISMHLPLIVTQSVRNTAFVGKDSNPDRLDFTSFSHLRFGKNSHESDQNELGYFASKDPEIRDKTDLVRRESKYIDVEPTKGGVVNVLCEDLLMLNLQYLDPVNGQWVDSWDSTQAAGQFGRLPLQVKMTLELRGSMNYPPLKMVTRTALAMQSPLNFALGRTQ